MQPCMPACLLTLAAHVPTPAQTFDSHACALAPILLLTHPDPTYTGCLQPSAPSFGGSGGLLGRRNSLNDRSASARRATLNALLTDEDTGLAGRRNSSHRCAVRGRVPAWRRAAGLVWNGCGRGHGCGVQVATWVDWVVWQAGQAWRGLRFR